MQNKKINVKDIVSIVVAVVLLAAHIIIAIIGINTFRYYNIYPQLFLYIFIIIICLFIIIDIVFFIGMKHQDLISKIIVGVLAICIVIGGCYGNNIVSKTNQLVDSVVDVGGEEKYETVSGVLVSYQNDKFETITSIEQLKNITNYSIGTLIETSENSISSIGLNKLTEMGISGYETKGYTNNTDLLFALLNHEIDLAIMSSMYQAIFRADENVDYTQYLADIHEIETFEQDILVASNTSNKDLSKDPFNVLLIGWSPIIGSTTIGLADAIIVATVNPQTYTVSMMSIARDSYVPISCYGGECDKINSGRGTSMDCFVTTVENLIGEEIDFYMEIDFSGFADLCGHFGGIEIDNPVSFELDGVYVPAGKYVADGWQALEFARERHHMPNGDFDRQQHQKEVIMQLAKQFLRHSLNEALEAFNVVSDRLNTNMTLTQLTSMFKMLTKTKNYTGLSLFNILDMHALRITGYADWHYSDEYELPLWIYRLYQGSIDESLEHMQETLGNYKTINQEYGFGFSVLEPYEREPFYSEAYDEVEIHETLPPYYPNLTSMTYDEAMAWAKANGATLNVTFISPSDPSYNAEQDGMIISQSVPYGKKVEKYPTCTIVVMGNGKRRVDLPDYESWGKYGHDRAISWCEDNGLEYETVSTYISAKNSDGHVAGEVYKMKYDEDSGIVTIYYYKTCGDNQVPSLNGSSCTCQDGYKDVGNGTCQLEKTYIMKVDGEVTKTETGLTKPDWSAPDGYIGTWKDEGNTSTFECVKCTNHDYRTKETVVAPTCTKDGYTTAVKVCNKCGHKETETINPTSALGHDYPAEPSRVDEKEATCTEAGYKRNVYICSRCGDEKVVSVSETPALEHSWTEWTIAKPATVDEKGLRVRTCTRCGEVEQEEIPKLDPPEEPQGGDES